MVNQGPHDFGWEISNVFAVSICNDAAKKAVGVAT